MPSTRNRYDKASNQKILERVGELRQKTKPTASGEATPSRGRRRLAILTALLQKGKDKNARPNKTRSGDDAARPSASFTEPSFADGLSTLAADPSANVSGRNPGTATASKLTPQMLGEARRKRKAGKKGQPTTGGTRPY